MFKNLNTSFWMNFTSNPSLQDIFHRFDLKMPPKGVKTCICESLNSWIFVKWFDGKKIAVIAFYITFPHCANQIALISHKFCKVSFLLRQKASLNVIWHNFFLSNQIVFRLCHILLWFHIICDLTEFFSHLFWSRDNINVISHNFCNFSYHSDFMWNQFWRF